MLAASSFRLPSVASVSSSVISVISGPKCDLTMDGTDEDGSEMMAQGRVLGDLLTLPDVPGAGGDRDPDGLLAAN